MKSKEDPLYDKPGDDPCSQVCSLSLHWYVENGTLRSKSFSYKKSVVQRGSQNL
jgi:hypothetical protein